MKMELPMLYGGGSAGEWPRMDALVWGAMLQKAKCNSNLIEGFAPTYSTSEPWYVDKTKEQIVSAIGNWVSAMRNYNVWTVIHLVNGGDESIKHFGAQFICDTMDLLAKTVGVDKIVMIAVAEHKNQAGHQTITEHAVEIWHNKYGGIIGYNGDGRPAGVPNNKYTLLDYHTQSQGDFGTSNASYQTLLDSDNGPIIRSLQSNGQWDEAKVKAWATACFKNKRGMNLYQIGTNMQENVFKAIGDIYAPSVDPIPVPDPVPVPDKVKTWWDKIRAWFKKVFKK